MASDAVRFRDFRLDPARRELWQDDELVPLPPRVFDCLAYLIEHRDRAVGRDELIAAVWGRVDVTDNLVDQIMLRARRAIEDTGDERYAIRTVPRFGYTWIAPVEVATVADAHEPATGHVARSVVRIIRLPTDRRGQDGPLPEKRNGAGMEAAPPAVIDGSESSLPRLGRSGMVAPAIFLLAAAAIAGVLVWRPAGMPERTIPAMAVPNGTAVVLPVGVETSSEHAWMRLGLMDAIAERLRGAGQPVVPSDNVVALARGFDEDGAGIDAGEILAIADAASATLVFEARAEQIQDRWRVRLRSRHGSDAGLTGEGEAAEPLIAAYLAADELALALGLVPLDGDPATADGHDLDRLLQEVKAAVWSERHDQARALLQAASVRHGAELEARYWLAEIDHLAGQDLKARAAFEALLEEPALADDPVLHAKVLYGVGFTYFRQSDYATAATHFDRIVERLESLHSIEARNQLGIVLNGRGAANVFLRRFDQAQADFARSRIALESSGDQLVLTRLDNNFGVLHALLDRHADALPHFRRAAELAVLFHATQPELRARTNLASSQLMLLDPAAALTEDPRLVELLDRTSDRGLRQFVNIVRSQVLMANGRLREAGELLDQMRSDPAQDADKAQTDWMKLIAAEHALTKGDPGLAARLASDGLTPALEAVSPVDFAHGRLLLLAAQLVQGQTGRAARTVAGARNWTTRAQGAPAAEILTLLTSAEYAAATGDDERAGIEFRQALAAAESLRVPAIVLRVSEGYARHLIRMGDPDAAVNIAGRSAAWAGLSYEAALLQLRLHHARGDLIAWQAARSRALAMAGEREIPDELQSLPLEAIARQ